MKGVEVNVDFSDRRYRLAIPKPIIESMGWADDPVIIIPNPDTNEITIKNNIRKPVGKLGFALNFNNLKWVKNKKQLARELNDNLDPESRKILHNKKLWSEIENGERHNIEILKVQQKQNKSYIHRLKKEQKGVSKEVVENHKQLVEAWKNVVAVQERYIQSYKESLKKKGGKQPKDLKKVSKKTGSATRRK
jgi:hypothetical protein